MLLLNADQQKAVDHDGHSLVVACPGSGKTRVISTKIGALIGRHTDARICAVTFTRDSAAELKHRVVKELGQTKFKAHCRVGTFHSLAIKQLRGSGLLGKVASPAEQRSYLKRALALASPEIPLDIGSQMIEQAKTTFGDCPDKQTPLYEAYRELLSRNKVEDLYDVLRRSVELMRDGSLPPIGAQFMLVDEFQDTDHVQLAWVMEHVRSGTQVTVVGDDDQSIYGWRGALGYPGMQDFLDRTSALSITLAVNYRSHKEILTAADRVIAHNESRVPKILSSARGEGGNVSSRRYADRTDEATSAAGKIMLDTVSIVDDGTSLHSRTVPAGSWAILSRNRFLLDYAEEALMEKHIRYRRGQGESIWCRPPFVFILGLMKSVQTGTNDGVDQALNFALTARLGPNVAYEVASELHKQLGSNLFHLLDDPLLIPATLEPEAMEVVKRFSELAVGWRNHTRAGRIATAIRGIVVWFASFEEFDDRKKFITDIGEIACLLNGSLVQRANALALPASNDAEISDGVALYTMHASKGLEFDNVWIVGCDSDTMPSPKSLDFEEERRLMYVAMTRAKNNLFMSSIIKTDPSPFLIEAGYDPRSASGYSDA